MIRSFVAILLGEAERAAVAAAIDRWRPLGGAVAWVPAANLHLTLQFLGSQPEERLAAAEDALTAAVAPGAPFETALHGVGAFPGLERPRILWVGFAQGALELRSLQARVADALAREGFAREARAWHPHLTIGRVHDERRWRRESGPALRQAIVQAATTRFGTLRVSEVALMRSDLSPRGARYTVRRAVALEGSAGARP